MTSAHRNSKSLWSILISLFFSGFLLLSQITFEPTLGKWLYTINTPATMSKTWWFGIIAQYGLRILADAAIIWALVWLVQKVWTVANVGHLWLLTFWVSLGIAVTLLVIGYPFWPQNVYNLVLPLTRNAFPFFTGLILFGLAQPTLRHIARDKRLSFVIWALLSLNLLWPTEVLKTNNGNSIIAAFTLGVIALILVACPQWFTRRWWLTLPAGVITLLFMGWYQASRQAGMGVAGRFVIAMSPLTLIPAILLVQFLRQHFENRASNQRLDWWQTAARLSILTSGLIATGAAYSNLWIRTASVLQKHLHFLGPLWVIISAGLLTGFATVITILAYALVPKLRIWTRLDHYWSLDLAHSLQQVVDHPKPLSSASGMNTGDQLLRLLPST